MSNSKECGHEGCTCKIAEDKDYCSDACQQADEEGTDEGCGCQHEGCGDE